MAVFKFMIVFLLVAYEISASGAAFSTLVHTFNKTIKGNCKAVAATTTLPIQSSTTASTNESTTTLVVEQTSDDTINGTAETVFCIEEENDVLGAIHLADFHTKLKVYDECHKKNCKHLATIVDELLKASGATEVKFCGLLLVLMFVISYFGFDN